MALLVCRFNLPTSICDDAFISLRTATHLSTGHGMVFNVGERVFCVTTPLWVFLLAIVRWFTSDTVVAAFLLGIISEVLLILTFGLLVRRLTGSIAAGALASTLLTVNPVFLMTSFSGMELSLSLWLVCLSLLALAHERPTAALLVAAIAVWARIDNAVLFAVALVVVLLRPGSLLASRVKRTGFALWPAAAVLAGYALFGLVYYGSLVPTSLRFKAGASAVPLSDAWLSAVQRVGFEFMKVFFGKSSYWYFQGTPYWIFVLPALVGVTEIITRRRRTWIPVGAFTVLWLLAYVAPGNLYAYHFPWYFVPVLPGLYAVSAWGCLVLFTELGRIRILRHRAIPAALLLLITLAWPLAMAGPLTRSADYAMHGPSGFLEREQVYAAAGTWARVHLPDQSTVAAVEIGGIGYYAGPGIVVLDMEGLARTVEDRNMDYVTLVKRHSPFAILTRKHFEHREIIEREMPGAYVWERFMTLDIGLRADLSPLIASVPSELDRLYDSLGTARESRLLASP